ncbi:MAG TPA: MFS transporter [Candidatus Limnocylindrales bacterium]|nr:MFS transporter [Candidatus Limnocylindrales bacterium]
MLITSAILAIFVYGMIAAMLGTILPDISQKFSLTPKQNGSIALFQAIGLMVGSFCVGPLMDIEGKKVGMLVGLGLVALALLLLRSAGGASAVTGAMFLLGIGGGVVVTAANSLNADIDPRNPAVVSNWLNLFFGLGGLVTPLVSAKLFQKNPRSLTLFAAVMAILGLVASVVAPFKPASGQVSFQFSAVGDLLANGRLLLLCLLLFLYVACEVGVWNWLVRHLVAQGVPEGKALTILSLGFALGLLIGRIAAAQILAHVDAKTVLAGAAALMAITSFLMLRASSPAMAQAMVFLGGLAMAPVFPTTLGVVGASFTGATAATAIGIAVTAGWFGLAVSSPIIGGIAGNDPRRLKKALLLIPTASVVMLGAALAL